LSAILGKKKETFKIDHAIHCCRKKLSQNVLPVQLHNGKIWTKPNMLPALHGRKCTGFYSFVEKSLKISTFGCERHV